jgi:hypothetical protein
MTTDTVPKSATLLGRPYGLTGAEMNYLLKKEGFLYGEPGAYGVTPKGEPYANEKDYHRGTGGYSWYNRYWDTRSWDPRILDDIYLSPECRREVQQGAAEQRRERAAARAEEQDALKVPTIEPAEGGPAGVDGRALLLVAGVIVFGGGAYKLLRTAIPRWRAERARAERLRRGQSEPRQAKDSPSGDDSPSDDEPA